MKHVREELPDIQSAAPEVSSALAAVLDRATAKDLGRRYQTDRELIADLEEVLAIETARAGQATGEATQVLRTLPPPARRRLPLRAAHVDAGGRSRSLVAGRRGARRRALPRRRPRRARHRHRPRQRRAAQPPAASSRSRSARHAADGLRPARRRRRAPRGDRARRRPRPEHDVVDRDLPAASLSKAGVGIYVDAEPGVAARALERPHAHAAASAPRSTARRERPPDDVPSGWTRARRRRRAFGAARTVEPRHRRRALPLLPASGSPRCRPRSEQGRDLRAPALPPQR